MDFRNVKSLTIPEGVVKKITSNGVVLWTAGPIWTWTIGESASDKLIRIPDGFNVNTWAIKLTLSVKLSRYDVGTSLVYYYDENGDSKTMSIQEDEQFTITVTLNDGHMVNIQDKVVNEAGFLLYYTTGNYIQASFDGVYDPTEVTLWDVKFIKPTLTMVIDDLVAAGELTATNTAIGSVKTLSNGITLHGNVICRKGTSYNYDGSNYNAAIRLDSTISGGIDLDLTEYTKLTLIGRSTTPASPRILRVYAQGSSSYKQYANMKFHDPAAGDVSEAVTLAEFDLTTIKHEVGTAITLAFWGNLFMGSSADICELRLE